jgi:hypothetical protein
MSWKTKRVDSIHTVSLARSSGSSRPRDCLYKSISQHRTREAHKCLHPSMHCNMIFSANQDTPYLFQERKRLDILFRSLYLRKDPYAGKDQNRPFNHFQLVLSLFQMQKVVEKLTQRRSVSRNESQMINAIRESEISSIIHETYNFQ